MIAYKMEELPARLKHEVEQFLAECPRSPAARLRPEMVPLRDMWLAYIGPELLEGASGIGRTPCDALEDFNRHFLQPLVSSNGHDPRGLGKH